MAGRRAAVQSQASPARAPALARAGRRVRPVPPADPHRPSGGAFTDHCIPFSELAGVSRRAKSAVTNVAAILRPPGTANFKYDPPAPVALTRFTGERFSAREVAGGLADPPGGLRRRRPRPARVRSGDPLLAIEPSDYIEALTGRRVGRDGKVACPFHPDETPSLHAYPDPARGWACYSARCWRGDRPNGGDIYSLAAQLWGLSTETDFAALKRRLRELLLPRAPEPPQTEQQARGRRPGRPRSGRHP
jgi:hypothetical protein